MPRARESTSSLVSSRRGAPDLFQPGVAAASQPIRRVADGTLLVEVLVVLLGAVELRRRDDLRDDLSLEPRLLLELAERLEGRLLLLVAAIEDRGAILRAVVAELRVLLERVHVAPEDVEELLVRDLRRVVHDLDRLGVARPAG